MSYYLHLELECDADGLLIVDSTGLISEPSPYSYPIYSVMGRLLDDDLKTLSTVTICTRAVKGKKLLERFDYEFVHTGDIDWILVDWLKDEGIERNTVRLLSPTNRTRDIVNLTGKPYPAVKTYDKRDRLPAIYNAWLWQLLRFCKPGVSYFGWTSKD